MKFIPNLITTVMNKTKTRNQFTTTTKQCVNKNFFIKNKNQERKIVSMIHKVCNNSENKTSFKCLNI